MSQKSLLFTTPNKLRDLAKVVFPFVLKFRRKPEQLNFGIRNTKQSPPYSISLLYTMSLTTIIISPALRPNPFFMHSVTLYNPQFFDTFLGRPKITQKLHTFTGSSTTSTAATTTISTSSKATTPRPKWLHCVSCKSPFGNAWDLMVHVQTAHMMNIYQLADTTKLQNVSFVQIFAFIPKRDGRRCTLEGTKFPKSGSSTPNSHKKFRTAQALTLITPHFRF